VSPTEQSPPKLAAQIARRIESDVVAAGWPVGTVVGSEPALQERYGVSRAVLREAVRIVEHHQVARMRRGRSGGLIVSAPEVTAFAQALAVYLTSVRTTESQVMQARLLLEPTAAGMAAKAITEEGISELRAALSREGPQSSAGSDAVRNGLHVALGRLSGNPAIAVFIEVLNLLSWHRIDEHVAVQPKKPKLYAEAHEAHRRIADAVIAGDTALAETRVAKHLRALATWFENTERRRRKPVLTTTRRLNDTTTDKIAEVSAHQIFEDIVADGLPEGTLLGAEPELLKRYGLSRSAFREAVRLLEYHSVARMQRGRGGGLVVSRPDPRASVEAMALYLEYRGIDYESLRAVRDIFELGCIEIVTTRRDEPEVRRRLTAALQVGPETAPADLEPLSRLFHVEFVALTENPVLVLLQDILMTLSNRHIAGPNTGPGRYNNKAAALDIAKVHGGIAEAILDGDAGLAKHRMRRHLEALTKE